MDIIPNQIVALLTPAAGILFLAVLVEGAVEHFVAGPVKAWGTMSPGEFVRLFAPRYAALVLGIAAAVGFRADLPAVFGLEASPPVAFAATGLVISRGANYVSDIVGLFSGKK